jgi:hypothetical protein
MMPRTMTGLTLDQILAEIGMTYDEVVRQATDVCKIGGAAGAFAMTDEAIDKAHKAATYTIIMGRWETLSYLSEQGA